MRKVKVYKETYIILRRIKVEDNVQIKDTLREAVERFDKNRARRLKKLAKKLAEKILPKEPEKEPEVPGDGGQEPVTDGDLQPDAKPPE